MALSQLQQQLLEILLWFHSFCKEHKLRYYALGGTFLGAVRHQGFIPWDDDIDVGMPLEDYLKFIELTKSTTNTPYQVESPFNAGKFFFYPYTKIYDTRTTLIENLRFPLKRGIYLDLFPLCGMGNTWKETQKNFWRIHKWRLLLGITTMATRKGRKWYKNLIVYIAKIISNKYLLQKFPTRIQTLILKHKFDNYTYVGNPVGAWGIKEIMPAEYLGEPSMYSFEKHSIYGPQQADAFLTHMYGNWKEKPPIEKQKSHHSYLYLNLSESYLSKGENL